MHKHLISGSFKLIRYIAVNYLQPCTLKSAISYNYIDLYMDFAETLIEIATWP